LKLQSPFFAADNAKVAPFTGVWIETFGFTSLCGFERVAPFTGVWIETCVAPTLEACRASRALHGRVD